MLSTARAGTFNFANVLKTAVESQSWQVEWHQTGPDAHTGRDGYALFHMEAPPHDRAMTFRRAYHYPFWQLQTVQQRWRFDVARSDFDAETIDPHAARDFANRLRARVLAGAAPGDDGFVLIPLQGHIRRCRSFQTLSPVEMVETVAATGQPCIATLHPNEVYDTDDRAALDRIATRHPNLRIGGQTMTLLRRCSFVATQNSAVAFDGFLLGKPAVLFGQIDFHHIGLNVAELGAAQALARVRNHRPDFDRYLYWFLQEKAINATRPDAGGRIIAAMKKGGWPI